MLGAEFRFKSGPASARSLHYVVCALTLLLLLFGVSAARARAQASAANSAHGSRVIELRIGDEVEPIMAEYIDGGIDQAARQHASLVLITMDTPGGLERPCKTSSSTFWLRRCPWPSTSRPPARAAPRRDSSFCFPRTSRPWLRARTPARLRRCWRSAAFR